MVRRWADLALRSRSMTPVQILAGGSLADADPGRAAVHDALGPEPSARIAADVLVIAQGVADAQVDLGVSDIAESLENKIRDMWILFRPR